MAASFPKKDENSKVLVRLKSLIDSFLPLFLLLTVLYLFVEFFGGKSGFLYDYKFLVQYSVLGYFLADILVLFLLYEDNKVFFRNHWLDIMLTAPFLTAFKGLKTLKILKLSKSLKIGKGLKFVKISQKIGKLGKKGKKLKDKHL